MELLVWAGGRWRRVSAGGRVARWRRRARFVLAHKGALTAISAAKLANIVTKGPSLPLRPRRPETNAKFKAPPPFVNRSLVIRKNDKALQTNQRHASVQTDTDVSNDISLRKTASLLERDRNHDKGADKDSSIEGFHKNDEDKENKSKPYASKSLEEDIDKKLARKNQKILVTTPVVSQENIDSESSTKKSLADRPQEYVEKSSKTDIDRPANNTAVSTNKNAHRIRQRIDSDTSVDDNFIDKRETNIQQSLKRKRDRRKETDVRKILDVKTSDSDGKGKCSEEESQCKELIIDEEVVDLLRNFLLKNNTNIDLKRFDEDDQYRTLIFFKINPLVSVERCPKIARLLSARSPSAAERFARSLGLQPNHRNQENKEKPKEPRNESGSSASLKPSVRHHLPRPEKQRRPFFVPKRSSVPPGREYSSLEDHAIVSWLSAHPGRERAVNGNRIWRELQDCYQSLTNCKRTWHSLRNRYLRYILPGLGALAIPPHHAARLRAHAATGELKARKQNRENSLLRLPVVNRAHRPAKLKPLATDSETDETTHNLHSKIAPPKQTKSRDIFVEDDSTTDSESKQKKNSSSVQKNSKSSPVKVSKDKATNKPLSRSQDKSRTTRLSRSRVKSKSPDKSQTTRLSRSRVNSKSPDKSQTTRLSRSRVNSKSPDKSRTTRLSRSRVKSKSPDKSQTTRLSRSRVNSKSPDKSRTTRLSRSRVKSKSPDKSQTTRLSRSRVNSKSPNKSQTTRLSRSRVKSKSKSSPKSKSESRRSRNSSATENDASSSSSEERHSNKSRSKSTQSKSESKRSRLSLKRKAKASPSPSASKTRSRRDSSTSPAMSRSSPRYSDVTRRFALRHRSTPVQSAAASAPPKKRRLYNPAA